MAKTVDEITIRDSEYESPAMRTTAREGRMAHILVTAALSTGLTRSSKKPSMTNCPAYVPVMVEL